MPNFISEIKLPNNQVYNLHDIETVVDTRASASSTLTGSASTLYDGKSIVFRCGNYDIVDTPVNLTLSLPNNVTSSAVPIALRNGKLRDVPAYSVLHLVYKDDKLLPQWLVVDNAFESGGSAVALPTTAGSYMLEVTVSSNTPSYSWVAVSAANGEEF